MNALVKKPIVTVRLLLEKDLEEVVNIEKASYDFPWTIDVFQNCLKSCDECSVILYNNKICGYGIIAVTAYKAHILNLCIHPSLRNNGLGMQMLTHLTELATTQHAEAIFLEVRPNNKHALAIYAKLDFKVIGKRKDYYLTEFGQEDALVLAKNIIYTE